MKVKNNFIWVLLIASISIGGYYSFQKISSNSTQQNIFSNTNTSLTELQKNIVKKFREGNAVGLIEYFNEEVAIKIFEIDDYYDKKEAENILLEFCQNHTSKKFLVKHHGINNDRTNFYLIGELITIKDEKYRVFIANNETKIEEIEITYPLNL